MQDSGLRRSALIDLDEENVLRLSCVCSTLVPPKARHEWATQSENSAGEEREALPCTVSEG